MWSDEAFVTCSAGVYSQRSVSYHLVGNLKMTNTLAIDYVFKYTQAPQKYFITFNYHQCDTFGIKININDENI